MKGLFPRLVVFSAGWNCERYAGKCIRSIRRQTYSDYVHVIVDDASTDRTHDVILKHKDDKTIVYRNKKNLKWLHNAVKYLDSNIKSDEDVIVVVDLDDWLMQKNVLKQVAKTYRNEKCWVTYGQCSCPLSGKKKKIRPARAYPEILKERDFRNRNNPWIFTHLQTFKAFLWNAIDKKDFIGPSGKYIPCCYDKALMFPILEMTPSDRIYFMNKVVYFYNQENPMCNFRRNADNQRFHKKWLSGRPRYKVLRR